MASAANVPVNKQVNKLTSNQGGGGSWSSLMNLKPAAPASGTSASTANSQPKKIASAGEAFEKYKMKLQEKNERVSLIKKMRWNSFLILYNLIKGKIFETKRRGKAKRVHSDITTTAIIANDNINGRCCILISVIFYIK